MNVLLVYPEFPDAIWNFRHALKFISKKAYSPPLGLLTVAAMLPTSWKLRLVDLNIAKLTDDDLEWADYAFISAMSVQWESARHCITRCKKSGVKIVAGGPLFMCDYGQYEEIDHFVLNEAELTLAPFLADLERGCAKRFYRSSEFADIKKTPIPLWELVDLNSYASMNIQFSRGCPYNCEFCNLTTLFGRSPRTKSVEQIISELNRIYSLGWNGSVFCVDDNFMSNKRHLKSEMLPALIEWRKGKPGITFYTEVSINLADDEQLLQMMAEAGFNQVFIGIETLDNESLDKCGKKQNKNRDLVENVRHIQRTGLQVMAGFIVGFDSDTPDIFQRQIDFIQQSGIIMANIAVLQAPPGTRLHERMKQEGRLNGNTLFDFLNGATNISPKMNLNTLQEGYKSIIRYIYTPEHYYARVKTFFREYKPPKIETSLRFKHFVIFSRSIYYLGIKGKERFYFWKLLCWTYFRSPKLIPLAVELAIKGHHFRKVVELHVT